MLIFSDCDRGIQKIKLSHFNYVNGGKSTVNDTVMWMEIDAVFSAAHDFKNEIWNVVQLTLVVK